MTDHNDGQTHYYGDGCDAEHGAISSDAVPEMDMPISIMLETDDGGIRSIEVASPTLRFGWRFAPVDAALADLVAKHVITDAPRAEVTARMLRWAADQLDKEASSAIQ